MRILENLCVEFSEDNLVRKYYYRLTETLMDQKKVYGIEVERQDYEQECVVNIEREALPKISRQKENVQAIVQSLHKNIVSPIHLIDVFGEEIDELAYSFS